MWNVQRGVVEGSRWEEEEEEEGSSSTDAWYDIVTMWRKSWEGESQTRTDAGFGRAFLRLFRPILSKSRLVRARIKV